MPPEVLADSARDEDDGMVRASVDGTKWDVFSYAVMVTFILRWVVAIGFGYVACIVR